MQPRYNPASSTLHYTLTQQLYSVHSGASFKNCRCTTVYARQRLSVAEQAGPGLPLGSPGPAWQRAGRSVGRLCHLLLHERPIIVRYADHVAYTTYVEQSLMNQPEPVTNMGIYCYQKDACLISWLGDLQAIIIIIFFKNGCRAYCLRSLPSTFSVCQSNLGLHAKIFRVQATAPLPLNGLGLFLIPIKTEKLLASKLPILHN